MFWVRFESSQGLPTELGFFVVFDAFLVLLLVEVYIAQVVVRHSKFWINDQTDLEQIDCLVDVAHLHETLALEILDLGLFSVFIRGSRVKDHDTVLVLFQLVETLCNFEGCFEVEFGSLIHDFLEPHQCFTLELELDLLLYLGYLSL